MSERGVIVDKKKCTDEAWFEEHLPRLLRMRQIERHYAQMYPDIAVKALRREITVLSGNAAITKIPSRSDSIVGAGFYTEVFMEHLPEAHAEDVAEWTRLKMELMTDYERFIAHVVKSFVHRNELGHDMINELMPEARIAFLHGILKYAPERGTRLSTMCYRWILSYLEKYLDRTRIDRYGQSLDDKAYADSARAVPLIGHERIPSPMKVDTAVEQAMLVEFMQKAFDACAHTEQERSFIQFRFIEGMSLEETGEVMGQIYREGLPYVRATMSLWQKRIIRRLRENEDFVRAAGFIGVNAEPKTFLGKPYSGRLEL